MRNIAKSVRFQLEWRVTTAANTHRINNQLGALVGAAETGDRELFDRVLKMLIEEYGIYPYPMRSSEEV